MAELSPRSRKELAAPIDEERLQHNLRGVRQRQVQRKLRRARVGASLASLVACALLALLGPHLWSPTAQHAGPVLATDGLGLGRLAATPRVAGAGAVLLDDGSRIHLSQGSRVELIENSGERVRTVLHAGWARFEVKPGGPRRWIVDAGAAQVEVVGTAFTVSHGARQTRVRVHHGRVLVRGQLVRGGLVQLGAGEELQLSLPLAVRDPLTRGAARFDEQAMGKDAPLRTAVEAPVLPAKAAQRSATALERADVLRATGKAAQAARLLASQLRAEPRASGRGLTALTLAQLQLDELHQPAQAAGSFALAFSDLSLPSALREQALARQVEALLKAGFSPRARAVAHDYEQRYPHGMWSSAIGTWLDGAQRRSQ